MKRKTKRKLLITINWIAVVIFFISLCFVDCRSVVPMVINATSLAWLILSGMANGLLE